MDQTVIINKHIAHEIGTAAAIIAAFIKDRFVENRKANRLFDGETWQTEIGYLEIQNQFEFMRPAEIKNSVERLLKSLYLDAIRLDNGRPYFTLGERAFVAFEVLDITGFERESQSDGHPNSAYAYMDSAQKRIEFEEKRNFANDDSLCSRRKGKRRCWNLAHESGLCRKCAVEYSPIFTNSAQKIFSHA